MVVLHEVSLSGQSYHAADDGVPRCTERSGNQIPSLP